MEGCMHLMQLGRLIKMKFTKIILIISLMVVVLLAPSVYAAANLQVTAFSCSPSEVKINDQFSCTATIQNTGDQAGTLTTATLYPDSNSWTESSSYPKTVNTNINSGASTQIVFSGLKGKKKGNNGFSKITLDDVADTFVKDNAVKVNVIDVTAIAISSVTSTSLGSTFTLTGQAVAGGNVDITLSFSATSGGCSIGNQASSVARNEMTDSQSTSNTWTVTMGNSDCAYTISAQTVSNPSGTATKTDSVSGTITCDSCASGSSSSSSSSSSSGASSGGGGGGGASGESIRKSVSFDSILPGTPSIIKSFHKDLSLTKMEIIVNNKVSDVSVIVDKLASKPVSADTGATIYKYLNISKTIPEASLSQITFEFDIEKSWITSNNIDEDKVSLYRYTTQWDMLTTTKINSNATHASYRATSPGLSFFAIGGDKLPVVQTSAIESKETTKKEIIEEKTTPVIQPVSEEKKESGPAGQIYVGKSGQQTEIPDYAIIIAVILAVLALGWFYYHGHKSFVKK